MLQNVDVAALEDRVAAFVRAFGLHRPDLTPCGEPVAVSQAHALAEMASSGPLAQWELAAALGLSKSTVSRLVGQLEERGWVVRDRASEGDARVVALQLTPAGCAMADRIAGARRERMARLLARLPEDEREGVLHTLNVLVEAARD
jgi:DNA-binding MarR family transcriptional regulator